MCLLLLAVILFVAVFGMGGMPLYDDTCVFISITNQITLEILKYHPSR